MLLHRQFFSLGWGWAVGVERGEGEPREGDQCRAGLALPPSPAAVGNPPHPTQSCLLSCLGLLSPRKSGYRFTSSKFHHHLSLPQFQQHCPSQVSTDPQDTPSPPLFPKSRCVPLINWGSESETTFSPQIYPGHIKNKREIHLPNFFHQILGIFGGSLKRLLGL